MSQELTDDDTFGRTQGSTEFPAFANSHRFLSDDIREVKLQV